MNGAIDWVAKRLGKVVAGLSKGPLVVSGLGWGGGDDPG